jgi:LacI family transcriptional regulator
MTEPTDGGGGGPSQSDADVAKPRAAVTRLADVAKAAGVSKSTASRVLNEYTAGFSVKPEIRERIVRAARELSYRPHPVMRALRAKRTNLIAVVGLRMWPTRAQGVTQSALAALMEALGASGYQVSTNFFTRGGEAYEMPAWPVDGAVVADAVRAADLARVEEAAVPYVTINGHHGPRGAAVVPDDVLGTTLAVEHLLSLGHARVAYLDDEPEDPAAAHPSVAERRSTYERLMRDRGLEPLAVARRPAWGGSVVGHYAPVLETARGAGATAILCYSHHQAVELLHACRRSGVRVPQDVSVATFNDEYPVALVDPPLTAVSVPSAAMGERAARVLVEMIGSGRAPDPSRIVLPEDLVVRESTAPPPPPRR